MNRTIIEITMIIDEIFPELSKHIDEMAVINQDRNKPEINETNRIDYQSSLDFTLDK